MNTKEFYDIYEKNIDTINGMKLKEEQKKEILKIMDEFQYQYKRLEKYCELNMEAYENELDIFLKNFMKKDDDVNYLYNELEQTKNKINKFKKTIFYKIYVFMVKIYRKIRGR